MSAREQKYDRQLRLWANSGQSNLESSHVCLLNASVLGSEALKNLILPGIGQFTIVDGRRTSADDVSNGFFLEEEDLDSPVASAMAAHLKELNPDVRGHAVEKSVEQVLQLDDGVDFWTPFSLVILTERHLTDAASVEKLKAVLWDLRIPLLLADNVGFYGYLHLVAKEVSVVETHPESLIDLRIDRPWPELASYVDTVKLGALDDTDHAHVPYVVILIQALRAWKAAHGGVAPKNYAEKKQFKDEYVAKLSRDINNEANFEEAYSNAWRASQATSIPSQVEEILTAVAPGQVDEDIDVFWVYMEALKAFLLKNDSMLPLSGVLPDMASDTPNYVSIQNIYREKAKRDQESLTEEVHKVLLNRNLGPVSAESIQSFCKNCRFLHVARGSKRDYSQEMEEQLAQGSEIDTNATLAIYFAMLEYAKFVTKAAREPSVNDIGEVAGERHDNEVFLKVLKELLVHRSKSYHNVASFMGGIVAQEALKLVTRQYRPLDNLYVYDGVHSISEKWKI